MAQFEIVWSLNVVFPIIVSHLCQNQGTFYSVELTLWYFEYEFGLITRHALLWDIDVTTWVICVTVLCAPSQTLSFFSFLSNSSVIRHSSLQGCHLHACPLSLFSAPLYPQPLPLLSWVAGREGSSQKAVQPRQAWQGHALGCAISSSVLHLWKKSTEVSREPQT